MDTTLSPPPCEASAQAEISALDFASCYRAVTARDSRFDGVFFTAVKTTGIYCRPVCSAKTPAATSCTFFTSAAQAEHAGFRPCLRCRPELAPYAVQQNLAYAVWQKICAGALNHGSLEELALAVGLSSRQLRRVLLQHFGVSPVELAQTQRLLLAKQLLTETALPITDVAFAAGFGSLRRFNDLFQSRYRLTPGQLRVRQRAPDVGTVGLQLRLSFRPPFSWPRMLDYFQSRRLHTVEHITAECYQRSVLLDGHSGWLSVRLAPQRSENMPPDSLLLQFSSSLLPVLPALLVRIREQFDLDANPAKIHEDLAQDAQLARILQPGLRVPGAFDRFELAIRAILGQQVSVIAANTLCTRLIARFGTAIAAEPPCPWPDISQHFPSSARLAAASVDEVASIGLPQRRAETIIAFARFAEAGGMQPPAGQDLETTLAQLCALPGIGAWSANYIALRALRFPNAFPSGDLVLQKALARLQTRIDDSRPSARQLEIHSQQWQPWRGYAAIALWHSMPIIAAKSKEAI